MKRNLKATCFASFCILCISAGSARDTSTANAAKVLELKGDDGRAVLTADVERFAGAISSFVWKGHEFLDRHDHGRELQSALFLDDLGPCYNPTEAGSQWDSTGPKSSSRVIRAEAQGGTLTTQVDAAFWLKPGTPVSGTAGCGWGARPDVKDAVNTAVTGGYLIGKAVSFGTGDLRQSLNYSVEYRLPRRHEKGKFDVVAAYLTNEFSVVEKLAGNNVIPVDTSKTFGVLDQSVLFSTSDGSRAFSIVCQFERPTYQFNLYVNAKTNALHCMKEINGIEARRYDFDAKVLFGTRDDVVALLQRLTK